MAKKPVHKAQDVIRKDGGVAVILDDVTPEPPATSGADDTQLWGFDCIALDAEGKPRVIAPQDTTMQGASVILPRAVLIALLDPAHVLADAETAEKLRLLEGGELTPIGVLLIAGTDKTALGHKMAAAWRAAHNTALDSKKG